MQRLSVIGNISRDHIRYPDGRSGTQLGGAAFHVAIAAAHAGAHAAPVSVIGADLSEAVAALHNPRLDLTAVLSTAGASASFRMDYDADDGLAGMTATYGVAEQLTEHALAHIAHHPHELYHVCCRRPLHAPAVLQALADRGASFSVDFIVSSAEPLIAETAPLLARADAVFTNGAEYRLLEACVDTGSLPTLIVTDGPRAVRLLRYGRPVHTVLPPTATPADVTGAGDTLAGTFLADRLTGHDDSAALHAAVAAASARTRSPLHRR